MEVQSSKDCFAYLCAFVLASMAWSVNALQKDGVPSLAFVHVAIAGGLYIANAHKTSPGSAEILRAAAARTKN